MRKLFLLAALACLGILSSGGESHAMRFGACEINPFLSLTERFTDNVFNTNADEQSDFSTVITPGVQIVFPRAKKRYHGEFIYRADLERFSKFTSENADNHMALGKFEIKLPVGLELHVSDEFNRNHDPRGTNISPELDFYRSNLAVVTAAYVLSDRFKARIDYSNYILDYEAGRNDFRNRTDNIFAGYLYYRILPKTSVFVEYDYAVVDFETSGEFDSKEHRFFGGITWDVTGKTKGTLKGGYGIKDFADPAIGGYRGSLMEIGIDHNLSSRHSLKVKGIRRTNETNVFGSDFFVTTGLSAEYFRKLTGKITGRAYLSYGRDSYRGELSRKDGTWEGGLGLIYQFKKWLRTEIRYSYTNRKSTIKDFSYRNSTYYLRVVVSP
jgi:hypothetical protein